MKQTCLARARQMRDGALQQNRKRESDGACVAVVVEYGLTVDSDQASGRPLYLPAAPNRSAHPLGTRDKPPPRMTEFYRRSRHSEISYRKSGNA